MVDTPVTEHEPALRTLIERVQQARASRGTLRIRGGGTKDFYGNPPRGEPLDMGVLSGISSYEPTELDTVASFQVRSSFLALYL